MTVVSDTSPLNYLVLIDHQEILPVLFGHILIPEAVWHELRSPAAPQPVKTFLETWPRWLERRIVSQVPQDLQQLDPGEQEAIALAQSVGASLVLLDEKKGRQVARDLGFVVTGTLGVLDLAARRGLVDLVDALKRLERTTFRTTPRLLRHIQEKLST
jgi:predicted nucleic acid-binding protein